MDKLDISIFKNTESRNIKIGELSQEVIDTLNLSLKPQNINIWGARIKEHCEKHKDEYSSTSEFYNAIQSIPDIIKNPDYVGIHKNGNIQFVKKYNDISLVGIKIIRSNNSLLFRTIYPITQSKLNKLVQNKKLLKM